MNLDEDYWLLARLEGAQEGSEALTSADILNICLYIGVSSDSSMPELISELMRQNIAIANILESDEDFRDNEYFERSKFVRQIVLLNMSL
jgi:hypothetical protein